MKPKTVQGVPGRSVSIPDLPHSKHTSLSSTPHLMWRTLLLFPKHIFLLLIVSFYLLYFPFHLLFLSFLSLILSVFCDHLGPKCLFTPIQLKTMSPVSWHSNGNPVHPSWFIWADSFRMIKMVPSFNKTRGGGGVVLVLFAFLYSSVFE